MKKLTRFVAMVMTLSMLAVSAFAETTDTAAAEDAQVQAETVATDEKQQAENAVLATVNGENVMQSDVDAYAYQISYYLYSQGYDSPTAAWPRRSSPWPFRAAWSRPCSIRRRTSWASISSPPRKRRS